MRVGASGASAPMLLVRVENGGASAPVLVVRIGASGASAPVLVAPKSELRHSTPVGSIDNCWQIANMRYDGSLAAPVISPVKTKQYCMQ